MSEGYFGQNFGRPVPGTDTSSAPDFDAVLGEDGATPWQFAERGCHVPAPGPIGFERYYEPSFVSLEVEHLWKKKWQVACREEDIPNVGDRIRYDIVNLSFVIIRTGSDSFKAFYNSCPHRARSLCDSRESGGHIRCAFHGWTWNIDGSMHWLPGEHDFPHVDKAQYALSEVKVGRWGGHVFINPNPNAPPLDSCLGVLKSHFADHPLENRYTAAFVRKRFDANWKIVQEAFLEAYHMVETHWDALPFSGDTATHYDCWEDGEVHVDRLTTPLAAASGWFDGVVSPQEALSQFLAGGQFSADLPAGRGESIGDARSFAAELKRQTMKVQFGLDAASATNSYLLDACRYFLYPNFHPWWGEGVPLWYRFLPDGSNPSSAYMEIRLLLPVPDGEIRPSAALPLTLDVDDLCADVPSLGYLGHIIDQDTRNIAEIQKGLQTAAPGRNFLTLARRQESSIAHFHEYYASELNL